jgi:predicted nuclease with RNAse H fold
LDIETTGLSHYYDNITIVGWSTLNKYNVHIAGLNNEDKLLKDLSMAQCIVTFNGSLYDLPFLKKTFNQIVFPKCHVDLRFFSKRVGYSGGQKVIEQLLGINREDCVKNVDGYEATILWHKYKQGNLESLKKLIEYNRHDIDGMKNMLEMLTAELIHKNSLPFNLDHIFQFSKQKSACHFTTVPKENSIYIASYTGQTGPRVMLKQLKLPKHHTVVGIDLTGSEAKGSGWSLLQENQTTTKVLYSDEELITETCRNNPVIISIDSPLSIPSGRTCIYDTDPYRDEFGITRECERVMAQRGVKSYPCLIQSMQKLTERGMSLAARFRELGFTVIESYPGAAQDILGIPRKGKSLELLINGLKQFGIQGDYDAYGVTHDELDAITSAIVGYFYLAGEFEALGNEKEGYLIVPKIS